MERERKAFQSQKEGKGKESFTLVGQGTVKKRFTEIFGTWTLLYDGKEDLPSSITLNGTL